MQYLQVIMPLTSGLGVDITGIKLQAMLATAFRKACTRHVQIGAKRSVLTA